MKAMFSKLMKTHGVVIGPFIIYPLFYIVSVFGLGYIGNYGFFLMFLSCLSILPNKETLMFEASMPGKREKSIDARYILSLILIVFYSVLMYVIGLGERSVNQFGFEILLSMVLLSIEYPVIFLCSKKLHGLTTALIAALMILALHLTNNNWPKESNISFVVWIIIGVVIFAVSRTITVKMYKKRGVTC